MSPNEIDGLLGDVVRGDPIAMGAWADLLEEEGGDALLIRGLRYAVKHKRRPAGEGTTLKMWFWLGSAVVFGSKADRPYKLPYGLVGAMPNSDAEWRMDGLSLAVMYREIGLALAELERILREEKGG